MEDLIPVVNKLQDVFSAIGQQFLDLPQIVVVGSQSSGKSSVLESIVGRDFLPRGSGIVTRRPLVLQLYCIKNDENFEGQNEEWGEFLHLPGKKFFDFQEIREEIQKETERTTGRNKGVSKQTINLKIYSPSVLNLTLVDLPGVTKVPTGDQPDDIERQIREMCLEFISNPNAVILAVSAANQDLSNSDGLQLALTADPEGIRSIGVLTKVDLMDQGTDAVEILANRVHPLRRGYVAVVNRSQKDINENMSVREGISKETVYFQTHSRYRSMLSKCGTATLTTKLNQILMQHIRECLPSIKSQISNTLSDVLRTLESLGDSIEDLTAAKQGEKLLKIISKFSTRLNDFVDGRGSEFGVEIEELCGGARILYLFNEVFARRLMAVNPFDTLHDQDIQTAMANSNGVRHPLFIPESSFDLLVRKQIYRLEQPGLQCVDLVYDEMIRMCLQVDVSELSRHPILRDRVFEVIHQVLRDCVKPTQLMISNIIQAELAHINTSHPDFIGGKRAILAQQQAQQQAQLQAQQQQISTAHPRSNSEDGTNAPSATIPTSTNGEGKANLTTLPPPTNGPGKSTANNRPLSSQLPSNPPISATSAYYGESVLGSVGGTLFGSIFRSQPPKSESSLINNNETEFPINESSRNPNVIRLKQVPERMKSTERTTGTERIEVQVIKTLIASYFDIVKKSFTDMVPKIIMLFLVNKFKECLQNELICHLYKESLFLDLLKETDDGAAKRLACKEMRDLLLQAMEIVNEVRDYNVFDR